MNIIPCETTTDICTVNQLNFACDLISRISQFWQIRKIKIEENWQSAKFYCNKIKLIYSMSTVTLLVIWYLNNYVLTQQCWTSSIVNKLFTYELPSSIPMTPWIHIQTLLIIVGLETMKSLSSSTQCWASWAICVRRPSCPAELPSLTPSSGRKCASRTSSGQMQWGLFWIYCRVPARWGLQQTTGLRAAARHGARDPLNT